MTTEADPIAGCWYRHLDKGQEFCVITMDEEQNVIEIQYFDGNLEEVDLQDWWLMDLEPIEEPENWAGALDIAEVDDFGTSITDTLPDDWNSPALEIPPESPSMTYLSANEIADEWGESQSQDEPYESS
jgi:hypothetical protein